MTILKDNRESPFINLRVPCRSFDNAFFLVSRLAPEQNLYNLVVLEWRLKPSDPFQIVFYCLQYLPVIAVKCEYDFGFFMVFSHPSKVIIGDDGGMNVTVGLDPHDIIGRKPRFHRLFFLSCRQAFMAVLFQSGSGSRAIRFGAGWKASAPPSLGEF